MVGDWDADDLAAMLEPFAERLTKLVPAWMQRLRHLYVRHQPSVEENTLAGARQNIERHYDLSNDLFALFLDDSMTYSSAWFMQGDTLEIAQARKVDRLLDAVGVALGTHLLEIGTGWGSLAISAARRGARSRPSPSPASSKPSPASGPPPPVSAIASTCNCATTATRRASTTRSSASR